MIARHPCIRDRQALASQNAFAMEITEQCNNCGYCVKEFECPALIEGETRMTIDMSLCIGCGVCADVCPRGAIVSGTKK